MGIDANITPPLYNYKQVLLTSHRPYIVLSFSKPKYKKKNPYIALETQLKFK